MLLLCSFLGHEHVCVLYLFLRFNIASISLSLSALPRLWPSVYPVAKDMAHMPMSSSVIVVLFIVPFVLDIGLMITYNYL